MKGNIIPALMKARGDEKLALMTNERTFYLDNTVKIEGEISKKGGEIKQLVDEHMQYLLRKVKMRKTERLKEMEMVKEGLELQKVRLESFKRYSLAVIDNASAIDVARCANDMSDKASELMSHQCVELQTHVKLLFSPTDLSNFMHKRKDGNIVGSLSC